MGYKHLIEKIAITLYLHEGGCGPDEYYEMHGHGRPHWEIMYPFQEGKPELAEHERDAYRAQACAVVDLMLRLNVIDIKTYTNNDID